mgnify:CR=1 FL=1
MPYPIDKKLVIAVASSALFEILPNLIVYSGIAALRPIDDINGERRTYP